MADIVFTKSADGSMTCICNGVRLHSAYNPSREAQRFVENISCDFNPKYILVTGAGLSYCVCYLRERFPTAVLCALHYAAEFSTTESIWDKTFYITPDCSLADQLYNYMGEEGIVSCLFLSWPPSEKPFAREFKDSWDEIKKSVIKSRNILATRNYFAKRWVKNAIRFCLFTKHTTYLKKGSMPVVICASGPSLKSSIPFIKKYRDRFFLMAVSSALLPLTEHKITPDFTLSTDGGYWAKLHISFAVDSREPLALSAESSCFTNILQNNPIIPLDYGDGISHDLLSGCGFNSIHAERNGTVSGTAASLALALTDRNVYFCGLDLAPTKGFAHTQPNELEILNALKDSRMFSTQTRTTPATFPNPSLEIYRDWFVSQNFAGRLYRLSNNFAFSNALGSIKDVNWNFFTKNEQRTDGCQPIQCVSQTTELDYPSRKKQLIELIKKHSDDEDWIKEAVPADYVVWQRSTGFAGEDEAYRKMKENWTAFTSDILNLLKKS